MNHNLTLSAQALAFAALIWLIASKIWPPLLAAIEERQKKIAEGLAAADHAQKNLAQAQEQVATELKLARAKANEIIEHAHQHANQIVDAAKAEALVEATRQKDATESEIQEATTRTREHMPRQVASLAGAGAEKLLRREIDASAHKALLDELATQLSDEAA